MGNDIRKHLKVSLCTLLVPCVVARKSLTEGVAGIQNACSLRNRSFSCIQVAGARSPPVLITEVQRLEGHTDRVWGLAWNPATGADGVRAILASCSGDKTVRIWQQRSPSSTSFDCKAVLEDTHTRTIRSCAWSPSGKQLATASFDATTAIWEQNGSDFECVSTLEGHENEVNQTVDTHLQYGRYLLTAPEIKWLHAVMISRVTIKVWDVDIIKLQSGDANALWRHVCTMSGYHDWTIFSVHWSREGIIATGAADDAICLFELAFTICNLWKADGVRTQAMEIIMEELIYDKNILFPFLQTYVRTRRSNASTFGGVLKCFSNGNNTKSIIKKINTEVAQLLSAHAFQAYISLHSTENKEDIADNSLPEICKNMILAFTCLKKTDECSYNTRPAPALKYFRHTAIPSFGKEVGETILAAKRFTLSIDASPHLPLHRCFTMFKGDILKGKVGLFLLE
ncbi:hypothetical protein L1887_15086 [Cichorium endivia]|nr:hypothetical protein L1887_15086 [Cichorium endivia]